MEEGLIRSDRLAPMQATSQVQTAGQSGLEFFSHSNNNKISFSLLFVLCIFWIYFFFFFKKKKGGGGREEKIKSEKNAQKKTKPKTFSTISKNRTMFLSRQYEFWMNNFFFQFSTPIKILQKPLPSKHSSSRSNNLLPPSPSHVTFHKRIKGWALFLQTVSANERALLILVW